MGDEVPMQGGIRNWELGDRDENTNESDPDSNREHEENKGTRMVMILMMGADFQWAL